MLKHKTSNILNTPLFNIMPHIMNCVVCSVIILLLSHLSRFKIGRFSRRNFPLVHNIHSSISWKNISIYFWPFVSPYSISRYSSFDKIDHPDKSSNNAEGSFMIILRGKLLKLFVRTSGSRLTSFHRYWTVIPRDSIRG